MTRVPKVDPIIMLKIRIEILKHDIPTGFRYINQFGKEANKLINEIVNIKIFKNEWKEANNLL